ncbi:MAG: peptidase, partial [Planctomycetes bacterium]|nr:peptidase [Planctomycetota bacterium]
MEQFGHNLGDDYFLANYAQLTEYWKKLDKESDRFRLVSIGKTEEGREQWMAIVTDPANMRRLGRYKGISAKLARAEGLSEKDALRLARDGKAVIWIDGGLHASEVLCAQVLMETAWQLVSRNDDETKRILRDVIVLLVHANPDGHDLVADWYMREEDPLKRSTRGVPRLYQKYVGHDNNRDFFAVTQAETKNMNRVMYREWYPQIMFNHHQTGPSGTVMFAPPFRDPFAFEVDPLVRTGLDMVSAAMHNRFLAEGKPGVTMRTGATYSGWWNGGLRTTAYFHNMVGILTETIGHPTPINIPYVERRQMPHADLPLPIEPQEWHFRQSVEYSLTANYAVLDYASRFRETILMNIWRMGDRAIAKGRTDSWVPNPRLLEGSRNGDGVRTEENRDARAYIIPSDQADYATATKFVNALIESGIEVRRAHRSFAHDGVIYPEGSYVVQADQAFRAHVISMFEPQVHPDDFAYPGAPPTPPYDSSGWTLAFSMGVDVVRVVDSFAVRLDVLKDVVKPTVSSEISLNAEGYVIDGRVNDAFRAMNRLQAAGFDVYRMTNDSGPDIPLGSFFVGASRESRSILQSLAREHGVRASDSLGMPVVGMTKMSVPRIALLDRYGGSMQSGWTRWIFEQFEFPFTVVYPPEIDAGVLSDYDVLVMVSGMTIGGGGRGGRRGGGGGAPQNIPEPWASRRGSLSVETSLPLIKSFIEGGGTVVTIGSATRLATQLELPVTSALLDEDGEPLGRADFFVPGSILRVKLDTSHPLAMGMDSETDVIFSSSPVFNISGG